MNEQNVHVSVSVVADGETVGRFDSAAQSSDTSESTAQSSGASDSAAHSRAESDSVDRTAAGDAEASSAATFELYRDQADEWRWRLRHDNGNIIADGGEGYSSKAAAKKGIESVKKNAAGASVVTH